ncbi:DUF397 domain-containing protein [Actinomadura parmotrematis]|uniref:DUF397 domain-containing protein n=1 Tax=Actinomadura parmotrematis TaxID=2864039 RepID=A0ABS7FWT7_9ACTN|nr:DUF397 domain-containing protein [Actinomadura parmotrematis]MBW8484892.1 DUF397 domain-containing protein [Actinomadura parmotrematis]
MTKPISAGAGWRKSHHSDGGNGCVEVATLATAHAVRDSKNPTGPILALPHPAWRTLLHHIKQGRHDL